MSISLEFFSALFPIPAGSKFKGQPFKVITEHRHFQLLGMALTAIKMDAHFFSTFFVSRNVNFSVNAEAVQSPELCGNEIAEVPETGRKDTVVTTLLVEVSRSEPLQYFSETVTIKSVRNNMTIFLD